MRRTFICSLIVVVLAGVAFGLMASCTTARQPAWETANPIQPLPEPPLGIDSTFAELEDPPTPETVRLGRWLFYDTRLSEDETISCATCHRPEHAFSEPTPVSTGIEGQKGARKAPSFVNLAWTIYPNFFWDGRAASLEEQAKGPITNPIEMGMDSHDLAIERLNAYAPYLEEAFGDPEITIDRVAKAIADYERTRMSGNSPYDRFQAGDESAMTAEAKLGFEVFFNKGKCNQCHLGQNFTDNRFHNLGIGWDEEKQEFTDVGRYAISGNMEEMGAFKTPGLRDCSKHAPFMHDGSIETLEEVMIHYNVGGIMNPHLSPKIEPLDLTPEEVDGLIAFMHALDGEGYMDTAPEAFPQ